MANRLPFSDEEILEDLKKLGYTNLSPSSFQKLKNEIAGFIMCNGGESLDNSNDFGSHRTLSSDQFESYASPILLSANDVQTQVSQNDITLDNEEPIKLKAQENDALVESFLLNKENEFSDSSSQLYGNSENSRIIKRKVLRHRDGQAFISEELTVTSNNSSQLNHMNDAFRSGSSLSEKSSNSSSRSGSIDSIDQSSCHSLQSSTSRGTKNIRRKKCDPVTRYHQYRQYWETFKTPGEKSHKSLRWTIREKMLDYDFA